MRPQRAAWRHPAFIALLSLAACAPSEDQAAALGEHLLQSLAFARQAADTATIQSIFQPDATYDDYAGGVEYRGIQEIIGYLTSVHDWGDDVYLNLGNVLTGSSSAVGEWFFSAVQARPIPDLISTGTDREVSYAGATVIEIEAGRIARASDYFDRAGMLLQLGARVHLPDGSILENDLPAN